MRIAKLEHGAPDHDVELRQRCATRFCKDLCGAACSPNDASGPSKPADGAAAWRLAKRFAGRDAAAVARVARGQARRQSDGE